MAKPNVHTASRDALRDAGVRADVIDEIMKRRRRKGGITLASLDEVQGVGPATLEQLGQALDFAEPPGDEAGTNGEPQPPQQGRPASGDRRGGSDDRAVPKVPEPAEQATDAAEATLRAGTEQAADLVAATVQGGAEATGSAAEAWVRSADHGARVGLQAVERATEAAAGAPGEPLQRSAQDASAFGRAFLELLQEQGQENLAAMTELSRAKGLEEVIRIQGGYLHGTLERMTELNRRWLALAGRAWPGVSVGEDRGGGPGSSTAR